MEDEAWGVPLAFGFCSWLAPPTDALPAERVVLIVPDVEHRRGWREYVVRASEPEPVVRRIGFRQ